MLPSCVVILFLGLLGLSQGFVRNFGCKLPVDVESEYSPILWNSYGRVYPKQSDDGLWYVHLSSGQGLTASCTHSEGAENHFRSLKDKDLEIECVRGSIVQTADGLRSFESLVCERELTEEIYRNGTCYNGFTNVEVAFLGAEQPFTLMSVCHNEDKDETLYVKSEIDGPNLHLSESINRPSFKEDIFFPEISANDCYSVAGQTATVGELVGSESLASEYIQQNPNLFMSRGHLTPNGDPIYAHEKKATFYYINAHPQWQTINGGNWNLLEDAVRKYAGATKHVLTVYTGTHGVTTLDDVNGNPVEIWLGNSSETGELVKRLPCPHFTWKVIHDHEAGTGVAVIQINNPYAVIKDEDILCENRCGELPWVTWNVNDVRLGFTICCDVQSFRKALPFAPNLGSLPLLKY